MGFETSTAERRAREEQERLSSGLMLLLTGGITESGGAFLVGVAAVAAMGALYPLVGVWSMLSFPVVFAVALLVRSRLRRAR